MIDAATTIIKGMNTRSPKILHSARGATLVESMIAFALVGMTAIAAYPIYIHVKKQSKLGDVKQLCANIVRGKLDEYRSGRVVSIADEATASGRAQLGNLSMPTMSNTSIQNPGVVPTVLSTGGFMYAKVRYNRFFPVVCNGVSAAGILPGTLTNDQKRFGMRECAGDNTAAPDDGTIVCSSAADQRVGGELPGFKLYVKLQLDTPWPLGAVAGAVARWDAGNCPNFGTALTPLYDFNGYGDAIRVTVTGVIDLPAAVADLGGIRREAYDRLMCSVTDVVRPFEYPVRYYLSTDGRIYTVHGYGLNGAVTGASQVFRSAYTQGAQMMSGISSFAVHPRNLSLYVLKPGILVRYSNCTGQPLDCSTTFGAASGFSDDGAATRPSEQTYEMLSSFKYIGMDFRTGVLYAMSADKTEVYTITLSGGAAITTRTAASAALADLAFAGAAEDTFVKPSPRPMAMRIAGFFIDPGGSEAFVTDLSVTTVFGAGSTYVSSVYRNTDTELSQPVFRLPVSAVGFSR